MYIYINLNKNIAIVVGINKQSLINSVTDSFEIVFKSTEGEINPWDSLVRTSKSPLFLLLRRESLVKNMHLQSTPPSSQQ